MFICFRTLAYAHETVFICFWIEGWNNDAGIGSSRFIQTWRLASQCCYRTAGLQTLGDKMWREIAQLTSKRCLWRFWVVKGAVENGWIGLSSARNDKFIHLFFCALKDIGLSPLWCHTHLTLGLLITTPSRCKNCHQLVLGPFWSYWRYSKAPVLWEQAFLKTGYKHGAK